MLKMRSCSSSPFDLKTTERSVDADGRETPRPNSSAGPEEPAAIAIPSHPAHRDRRARSPPAPVREKTTVGYPFAGIGARGIVTTMFARSRRCIIGFPPANTHSPPVFAYGGVPP
jgi:hypothetical protein